MRMWRIGAAALLFAYGGAALAQEPAPRVHYEVSFPNAVHHEARISVTYRDVGPEPLTFRMARSSPGRYAIHEFAKNVYSLAAADGAGRPLAIVRDNPYEWVVSGHDGTVTVTYTLFADRADGTYSQIDETHAHLNAPATFLWARGHDERPLTVTFRPGAVGWRIATQLEPTPDPGTFRAPNLQYFMDSPVELSAHEVRQWQVDDGGTPRTIRLVVHHAGTAGDVDRLAERARRVVDQQIAIFGDVPDFDFGTYTFLADYLPQASGDGMEHRNSTYLTSSRSLREADFAQLGTLSHEFFHAWNVERLRPAELEPFDFARANPTPSLWFAEGFTSYYGPLAIRRAGLSSVDEYLENLSATLDFVVNAPGRRYGSPQEMSLRAPFVDAAESIDPTNNANIFVSYYAYGAIVALALDLTLRQRFESVTLDDYMRLLWRTHGVTERPYTPRDLRRVLAEVTGDPAFADAFFDTVVEGGTLPDFAPLLARAGLQLRPKYPGRAWAGPASFEAEGGVVKLSANTLIGTPLYEAGLERGDSIVSLGGRAIGEADDWDRALARHTPGEQVEIRFTRHGRERRAEIALAWDPVREIVRFESANVALTSAQASFRGDWLGADTGEDE